MKNLTKILALLIAVLMLCGTAFAEATDLPRNETVYFGGQQWGSVVGTNPLSSNNNNSMAVAANARGSRTISSRPCTCTICWTASCIRCWLTAIMFGMTT